MIIDLTCNYNVHLSQKTGDIIFRVDGKLMYAHKTILKVCGSDQFGRMFGNNEQK